LGCSIVPSSKVSFEPIIPASSKASFFADSKGERLNSTKPLGMIHFFFLTEVINKISSLPSFFLYGITPDWLKLNSSFKLIRNLLNIIAKVSC
jgi:hypothetical protein